MASVYIDGETKIGSTPTNNITVSIYRASRFASPPIPGTSPPAGAPDYTAVSGTGGSIGTWRVLATTEEDFYAGFQSSGVWYWGTRIAAVENSDILHTISSGVLPEGYDARNAARVSIRAYGAVGDGVTDDTAAIVAAAAAAKAQNGTLWIDAGVFRTVAQMIWDSISVDGPGPLSAIIKPDARAVGTAAIVQTNTSTTYDAQGQMWPTIGGFQLVGANSAPALGVKGNVGDGIQVAANGGCRIRNMTVRNFDSGAVYANTSGHIYLDQCFITANYYGVYVKNNSQNYGFSNSVVNGNLFANFATPADQGITNSVWHNVHMGFAPYGIYQESTPNPQGTQSGLPGQWFLKSCKFIEAEFEAIGNSALLSEAPFNIAGQRNTAMDLQFELCYYSGNATYKIAARDANYALQLPRAAGYIRFNSSKSGSGGWTGGAVNILHIQENALDALTWYDPTVTQGNITVDNGGTGNIFVGRSEVMQGDNATLKKITATAGLASQGLIDLGGEGALTDAANSSTGAPGSGLGDKLNLWGDGTAQYGLGIQSSRAVIYVPSGASVAVRQTAATGQKSSGTDAVVLGADGRVTAGSVDISAGSGTTLATGVGTGDKIALYQNASTGYGFGIQASRLVAYVPSTAGLAVRSASSVGNASSGADAVVLGADGHVTATGALATGQSATAPALATGGTISTANVGVARVAPAAAVTGVILQAGTVAGQQVVVVNESAAANTITFAAAPGGNVADGASSPIAGLTSRVLVWDSATSLWYRGA